jgi:putative spermidine/putrescine transport system permease protein
VKSSGLSVWRSLRGAICLLVALYLIAPLTIVVIISFSGAPFLQFPPPSFSLRWYDNLFTDAAWGDALRVSLSILLPSACGATVLGTAAAYAIVRGRLPGADFLYAVLMMPIIVPSIITAAALFGLYRLFDLNGTLTGLIIAHIVLTTPYVIATVGAALRTLDPRLEAAAATLGAPPVASFRYVTLPLLAPAILSGFLFAAVSMFVSTARTRPISVQMWSNIRGDVDPTIAAIASLSFAFALLALLGSLFFTRRPEVDRSA